MTSNEVSISFDHTSLKCDVCGSDDIVDDTQGYVCKDCGIVLTVQKLQYDIPYTIESMQHSIRHGVTQIGTLQERKVHPHSSWLKRIHKHNFQFSTKGLVKYRATQEISRIFESLSLPRSRQEHVKEKFMEIYPKLKLGSKYKNPEKLVAIIIYMELKLENIVIKRRDLVRNSTLAKKEFNNFFMHVRRFFPHYPMRNRSNYVMGKILGFTEHFNLGMSFYLLSKDILTKLWEGIKYTTDDVIAGLCTSIATLCKYKDVIKISSICEFLNIQMSTIQFQVKNRIFEEFKLPGFVSLVKSSALLKGFIERIGIIKGEPLNAEIIQGEVENSEEKLVSIQLGDSHQIFNPHNDYYLLGTVDKNKNITLCYLEVYCQEQGHDHYTKKQKESKTVLFDLTSGEYYHGKGPPIAGAV
ncbi:MAG: hypothetical protein ACXACX_02515 [Candidatus Hodarchaeales archaeon]|jgi:transcription initiation factor TFIIIB Brf1 subunit/transcription initiation factor TFIIB